MKTQAAINEFLQSRLARNLRPITISWYRQELEPLASRYAELPREPSATDAEVLAYIYPRALEAPMDSDWTQIYLYVAAKVMSQAKGTAIPDDIRVDSLNDYQMGLLRDLKDWIYEHRVKVRRERRRAEKAWAKAEAAARAPEQLKLGV